MSAVHDAVVFTTLANFTNSLCATIVQATRMARSGGTGGGDTVPWRKVFAQRIQASYASVFSGERIVQRAGAEAVFQHMRAARL